MRIIISVIALLSLLIAGCDIENGPYGGGSGNSIRAARLKNEELRFESSYSQSKKAVDEQLQQAYARRRGLRLEALALEDNITTLTVEKGRLAEIKLKADERTKGKSVQEKLTQYYLLNQELVSTPTVETSYHVRLNPALEQKD
jgi:hypothetical protein